MKQNVITIAFLLIFCLKSFFFKMYTVVPRSPWKLYIYRADYHSKKQYYFL